MHSPFRHSVFATTSSQCSFQPPFSFCSLRSTPVRKKKVTIVACLNQENQRDIDSCTRRVVLVMGLAVIRLLKMRGEAIHDLAAENAEVRASDQKQNLSVQGSSSQNPFSLLNALGFLGSGVFAAPAPAPYASTMKEMATSGATIKSMNMKLKEKEAAITSMEKKFEEELLNEKEVQNKTIAKVIVEKQSLVNQLKLANDMITSLGQEFRKEKRLVEELMIQIDDLECGIHEAADEKRQLQQQLKEKLDSIEVLHERITLLSSEIKDKEDNIWHLNTKLADKDGDLNQLGSVYQQSEDKLKNLNSDIKQLKYVLLKNEEELEMKNEMVHELNAELTFSLAEKDESSKKLDAILKEFNQYKSSTEMKSASDAKELEERGGKIHLLEEQLKISLDEVNNDKVLISALAQEKDKLREMLNIELKNVKNLEEELKITRDALDKSRDEASGLAKHLQESRHSLSELEEQLSMYKADFIDASESSQKNVVEARQGAEVLGGELRSANELLRKTNEEVQIMSQELVAAVQKCDSLEKELVDALRKTESAAVELDEEKKMTFFLNKEMKDIETQLSSDKEARRNLESDLEEATKSLSEMNRNALILSRELELANSQISSLEDEKDALYKSLNVRKQASQEAGKNLEDAHNLVMRLGKIRESLTKREQKLEDELASAKGEILRLRSQISSSKTPVNNVQHQQKVDMGGNAAASTRKVNRSRNVNPHQQDS